MTSVYISVDMEGVAGVADPRQVRRGSDDYPAARRLMTHEANAAIVGALAAGATTVVVNDGHGDNGNILPEELDPRAELMMGAPKVLGGMVKGVEEGYDACLLIGYHASVGTLGANFDHTISSTAFWDVRVNGDSWSEADLNCAIAGWHGVPVTLFTGDDRSCEQVLERHPGLEVVVTKRAYSHSVVKSLGPQVACERIQEAAERSIVKRHEVSLFRPQPPFDVAVDFLTTGMADRCSLVPGITRVAARTVSRPCEDAVAVRDLLSCFALLAGPR